LEDVDGLAEVKISFTETDDHGHSHGKTSGDGHNHGERKEPVFRIELPLSGGTSVDFSNEITFARNQLKGDAHYVLRLLVKDTKGNANFRDIKFHVKGGTKS
jgi:hypothetical protein